jgi:hypothetical protein
MIQSWLKECQENHDKVCVTTISGRVLDESQPNALPTRVLDVEAGDSSKIRLVQTDGLQGRYVALSHCWGPPEKRPLRTVGSNIGSHLAGIPVSSLPKTFRDAVAVTRFLGIRYLWIDSLCIIQDNTADWTHEAARMGRVYELACLTIAASSARDSTEGLFFDIASPDAPLSLPYPIPGQPEQLGSIYLRGSLKQPSKYYQKLPLSTRGWVTQEAILSRRIAYFTDTGPAWNCVFSETDVKTHDGSTFQEGTLPRGSHGWHGMVMEYCSRSLTYVSDKPVALQGIEERMGECVHGCRQWAIPDDLVWHKKYHRRAQRDNFNRPAVLQDLPSWSWASTMGELEFFSVSYSEETEGYFRSYGEFSISSQGNAAFLHASSDMGEVGCTPARRYPRLELLDWADINMGNSTEEMACFWFALKTYRNRDTTLILYNKADRRMVGVAILDCSSSLQNDIALTDTFCIFTAKHSVEQEERERIYELFIPELGDEGQDMYGVDAEEEEEEEEEEDGDDENDDDDDDDDDEEEEEEEEEEGEDYYDCDAESDFGSDDFFQRNYTPGGNPLANLQNHAFVGLLVQPVATESGHFRRIGLALVADNKWYKSEASKRSAILV